VISERAGQQEEQGVLLVTSDHIIICFCFDQCLIVFKIVFKEKKIHLTLWFLSTI